MKVFVFGNRDLETDKTALQVADQLKDAIPNLQFVEIKPNEDVPFVGEKSVVILDVVMGIDTVTLITENNIGQLVLPPRSSVHDFDLGFQLKYLKKLGKINTFVIIGMPMSKQTDYDSIQSILRKLVAQDMQGS